MSDDASGRDAGASDGLTPGERVLARMAVAQTVTAVVAVVISCAAMYAAWTQADAARIQIEAQTWPRLVTYANINHEAGEVSSFQLMVANHGVGPAEVRAMRLTLDGAPVTSFEALFDLMGETEGAQRSYSYVADRIFAPGEAAAAITVRGADDVARLLSVIEAMEAELCYCSIVDRCWLAGGERFEPVNQCPDYGEAQFRNQ